MSGTGPVIVDTSALMAVLFDEPEADRVLAALGGASERALSAVGYVEAVAVLANRNGKDRARVRRMLDRFLRQADVTVAPVDAGDAEAAADAYLRYGRGSGHAAGLNLGDVFSYALAVRRGAPLVYVGEDFVKTDVSVPGD